MHLFVLLTEFRGGCNRSAAQRMLFVFYGVRWLWCVRRFIDVYLLVESFRSNGISVRLVKDL